MSPQSLARTRDKRSLRVPRKFEDFSLVTSAETPIESLSISTTSTSANISSTSISASPTPTTTPTTTATTSPPPAQAASTSRTPTPAPSSAPEPAPTATVSTSTSPLATKPASTTPPTTTTATTTTTTTTTATPTVRIKIEPLSVSVAPATTGAGSTAPAAASAATSAPPTSTLVSATTATTTTAPSKQSNTGSIKSSSARKKSKGQSLMVKSPTSSGPFQNNDSVNRPPVVQQQPTKFYNGLAQNMQYGTRLMLNEPIYLPQSVPTIAPITTTLQQIANQARRPPFLSKKAEACFAFQEQRKLTNVVSNYMAIIRITKYLELEDVLNLKCLNRSWQSALSCEAAWQRVLIKSTNIINWKLFAQNILARYHTSELILDQFSPSTPTKPIVEALANSSIKRLWIKTADEHQNRFAMELICGLNVLECHVKIKCRLKVVVDDNGLALVPIACQKDSNILEASTDGLKPVPLFYCYQVCPELLNTNNDTILVELSDLEELFNRCSAQTLDRRVNQNPRVDLKPI